MNGMYGIYRRIRGFPARLVGVRTPGPVRVVIAAVTATVLAVGVGVVWGLAGAGGGQPGAGGTPVPHTGPGGVSAGSGDGLATAGPPGEGGNPPGGGGPGSGAGPGDAGGGPAGNRPPVIEDPGLSSDGMTLTVAPTVTDPDGDEVTVAYTVDGGQQLSVADEPVFPFPVEDYDYRYEPEVTVIATDANGATTRETVIHQLEAVSTVVVRRIELRLEVPQSCFASVAARRFTADLTLTGAVTLNQPVSEELRADRTTATLLPTAPVEREVIGEPPRLDVYIANAELAGERDSLSLPDIAPPVRPRRMFLDSGCRANLRFGIQITTR